MDFIAIIALIIGIIALIIAIIALVWFSSHRSNILSQGIDWTIQPGTSDASKTTDSMNTGGNNLYIGNSPNAITLSILTNTTNTKGSEIMIYNNSADTITLASGTGVSVNTNTVLTGTTVEVGTLAILIIISTDSGDTFLRVQ